MKGYKVFNPDWTCRGYQYTCPGTFEEDVVPSVGHCGFHFCENIIRCFSDYSFDPNNKVAEVIAVGDVDSNRTRYCTNKIRIIREVPWDEVIKIANIGSKCYGFGNVGCYNNGNFNIGDSNDGKFNVGNKNKGSVNLGRCNIGNCNIGDYNIGGFNTGYKNNGNNNTGDHNIGYSNSGQSNRGHHNSGRHNIGNNNSGDWNKTRFSSGCFCTQEPKILMFNKPSEWTFHDWDMSEARYILNRMPFDIEHIEYVKLEDMSIEEKAEHPESKITGGYLRIVNNHTCAQDWWAKLSKEDKSVVMTLPNFDKDIFKEITGIDVDE